MSDTENIMHLDNRFLGHCCICGRALSNSESIESFMGPICSRKYTYLLDFVTNPANPEAFADACNRAEIKVNLDAGLNKASNEILRMLSRGMPESKAEAALDAIMALGYNRLAAVVGSSLGVSNYEGASLDKAVVKIEDNIIVLESGKISSNFWQQHLDMIRAIPTRRWDAQFKRNIFKKTPQAAKGLIALCDRWFPFAEIEQEILELAKQKDIEVQETITSNTAIITLVDNGIHIKLPKYNSEFVNNIKSEIPGRSKKWVSDIKVWWVSVSHIDQAIAITTRIYPDAKLDPKLKDLQKKIEEQQKFATATTVNANEEIEIPGGKLYPFQSAGVRFLELKIAHSGGAIIADDMGLGKTIQLCAFLARDKERLPALIVCPASVKLNWARQIMIWIDGDTTCVVVEGNFFSFIDKNGKKQRTKYNINKLSEMNVDIVVVNYDLLKKHKEIFINYKFKTFGLDESHYVKESKSGRSQAAREIANSIPRRVLLTGTPVLNRPRELWHQLHIVDPIVWDKFYPFGYKYCDPQTNRWGTTFNGAANLEELHNRVIGHFMVRRRKKDVLKELPDKTVYRTQLEIPTKERKEYDEALRDFKAWALQEGGHEKLEKVLQAEAISRLTTLKRLCAESKTIAVVEHCKEWLDSNENEQLIVFAHHHTVVDALEDAIKKAGFTIATIRGGDAVSKRQTAVDAFKNGEARVFVASIQAAGTGTDGLQVCQNMKVIERTWRPADMVQAEDRIHRIGQSEPCFVEYLDMENSIDDHMAEIIENKMGIINQIVDGTGSAGDIGDISKEVLNSILEG